MPEEGLEPRIMIPRDFGLAIGDFQLIGHAVAEAAASPAVAEVHTGVVPTVLVDHPGHGGGLAAERGTGNFRGRYHLRLPEARNLLR